MIRPRSAAIALMLLVAYPSLAVPQAMAPSHPVSIEGGVQGFVLSDVGSPLAGAFVQVQDNSAGTVTAEDGSYFLDLPAGSHRLTASARAHEAANATVVVGAIPASHNFTLEHTGPVLRGTVRDAKSGGGLGGVIIQIDVGNACKPGMACPLYENRAAPEYYRMPFMVRSQKDGKYAVAVENGSGSVSAHLDGYRPFYQALDIQRDQTLDLRLEPYPPKDSVLQGVVRDAETGQPIVDAWVSAWPYQRPEPREASPDAPASSEPSATTTIAPSPPVVDPYCCEGGSAQTDREGRFRMALYANTYMLSVGAPGYGQHQRVVELDEGETEDVEVELEPIPGDTVRVRGQVLDGKTGRPVAGAWVSIENQQWGAWNGTNTDDQGRFDLRTKPGWTLVWVRADGGYGYVQGRAVPVEGSAGGGGSAGGAGTAEGNATSAEPEPSDDIRAPEPSPPPPRSGPDGSYYPWVKGQVLGDGQTVDLRVELIPKPAAEARIVGYVLNATSKNPIPNAWVNVHNEDTGDWGSAQTDEHGSFVLLGREGTHTVQAYAEGYFANAAVVKVEGEETRIDLSLQPGRASGYCCIAYAEGARAADSSAGGPPPPAAPPAPMQGSASSDASAGGLGAQGTAGFQASGPATYQASGEGLGPYRPPATQGEGEPIEGLDKVPAPGALLALAALGLVGLALRRRRA